LEGKSRARLIIDKGCGVQERRAGNKCESIYLAAKSIKDFSPPPPLVKHLLEAQGPLFRFFLLAVAWSSKKSRGKVSESISNKYSNGPQKY